jgi:NADH:ubiquinone oxidoreductase subunit E
MAFGLPKASEITAQLNAKFDEMMTELKAMRSVLMQILAAIQKENPQ